MGNGYMCDLCLFVRQLVVFSAANKQGNYTPQLLLNARELSFQPKPFRRAPQKRRNRCMDVRRCDQYAASVCRGDADESIQRRVAPVLLLRGSSPG